MREYPEVLHLGCGKKKYPGSFGVDFGHSTAADLTWDLDETPWPLPADTFHRVYMVSVLEHVENVVAVMEEVWRVCQDGAEVRIYSPHASSHHLWTDPTHRRGFTSGSFKYFTDDFSRQHFEYSRARLKVLEVEYNRYEDWMWVYRPKWYDRALERLANRHKALYEKRFMYWYPVQTIFFRLEVVKRLEEQL